MKLRILTGLDQGKLVEIPGNHFTIGRDKTNDLVIIADGVSRKHVQIVRVGSIFFAEDCGSTNGIRINGEEVKGKVELKNGERLGIGEAILLVVDPPEETAAEAKDLPPALPFPPPVGARRGGSSTLGLLLIAVVILGVVIAGYFLLVKPMPNPLPVAAALPARTPLASGTTTAGTTPPPGPGFPGLNFGKPAVAPAPVTPPPPAVVPAAATTPVAPSKNTEPSAAGNSTFVVQTEPSGATVTLDGQSLGSSPVVVAKLPPGRHLLAFSHPGYEDLSRQILLPDMVPEKPYVLRQKAATLLLTSEPAGAVVHLGPRILGQTPLMLAGVRPDAYQFSLTVDGFDPATVKATISDLQPATAHAILASRLGSLEIVTVPAGFDVAINGQAVGVTESGEGTESKPLHIEGVPEGPVELKVVHPAGITATRGTSLIRGKNSVLTFRFWVPDTEVVLTDGARHIGMVVEQNEQGDIVLKTNDDPERMERFLKPQLVSMKPIPVESIRSALAKAELAKSEQAAQTAQVANQVTLAASKPVIPMLPEATSFSVDALLKWFADAPDPEAARENNLGHRVIVSGIPGTAITTRDQILFSLDKNVQCRFDFATFSGSDRVVTLARIRKQSIAVSGILLEASAGRIVLSDCQLAPTQP